MTASPRQQVTPQQMLGLLQQEIARKPDHAEGYLKLGLFLAQYKKEADAISYLKKALTIDNTLFQAHLQLGIIYLRRYIEHTPDPVFLADSIRYFSRARTLQPNSPAALEKLGIAYRFSGQLDNAIECFSALVAIEPNNAGVHYRLAVVYSESDRHEEALKHFDEAIRIDPTFIGAYASKAIKLERMNLLEEARATVEEGLKRAPDDSSLLTALAKLESRTGELDAAREHFIRALEKPDSISAQLEIVYTELGKIYDKQKKYSDAFAMFEKAQQGFSRMPQAKTQNPEILRKNYENCMRWFTRERVTAWKTSNYKAKDGNESPSYIAGFPRSGTTLAEQILSSHPRIVGTQEEPIIDNSILELPLTMGKAVTYPDVLSELNEAHILELRQSIHTRLKALFDGHIEGKRILDKMPLNTGNLGFIQRLFPDARIIMMIRDPRDVVLSCFMQSFQNNMAMANFFTLENTARFYAQSMELYAHYTQVLDLRILEIKYETLVSDIEGNARTMLDFLGMKWSEDVLHYYAPEKNRHVVTPSYEGVMRPAYNSSIGRWKHYAAQMAPVLDILAPFVKRFGYDPS